MRFSDYIIPVFIAGILIYGLIKKVDIFDEFTVGAKDNLIAAFDILPALIALMTCVGMLNASGAADMLCSAVSPFLEKKGFPAECAPLAFLRPISGSGALAVYEQIISENGPDSFAGRVASVLLGASETTFYTIAVYFGAVKAKKTRHALPCSLAADLTAFILSALFVRVFFA